MDYVPSLTRVDAGAGKNTYRISLAVAGFKPDEIAVSLDENTLVVTGQGDSGQEKGE